ncbi:MAG: hypothetical protein WBA67_18720, partial [Jannaschia sp.]
MARMVKAYEIDSREKLQEWLEALPSGTEEERLRARQIAVGIAFRAAARVFPFAVVEMSAEGKKDDKRDLTSLTVYR